MGALNCLLITQSLFRHDQYLFYWYLVENILPTGSCRRSFCIYHVLRFLRPGSRHAHSHCLCVWPVTTTGSGRGRKAAIVGWSRSRVQVSRDNSGRERAKTDGVPYSDLIWILVVNRLFFNQICLKLILKNNLFSLQPVKSEHFKVVEIVIFEIKHWVT